MKLTVVALALCFTMLMIDSAMGEPEDSTQSLTARFAELPTGAVRPQGWLRDQLRLQANGITGYLEDFWPDVGPDSAWKGGKGEGWERGPYYLDGLVPLAYILNDERLIAKVKVWVEWMLKSQQPSGWFGPPQNKDRWPLAVALKAITQYYDATKDERVVPFVANYFRHLNSTPPDWPDHEWRGVRGGDNAITAYWLYRINKDPNALPVADAIRTTSFDWAKHALDFPYTSATLLPGQKYDLINHGVNNGMAIKYPALWFELTQDKRYREATDAFLAALDKYHGQAAGRFSCDEHLAGHSPTHGTELCTVVEQMFSLEHMLRVFGDASFADRIEALAYNALPGTMTPDTWGHQYDQQSNQVLCSNAKRAWVSNQDSANVYGVEPNYGCCTANLHQGWPKLVSHMWMGTPEGGLVAVVYGPCEVKTRVGGGAEVTISQNTHYPFAGKVTLNIQSAKPVKFPLMLRIPAWAVGTGWSIAYNEASSEQKLTTGENGYVTINREWHPGDEVRIDFPMPVRTEKRYNDAISLMRGPLYMSLRIGEKYIQIPKTKEGTFRFSEYPHADWEIHPTTPWNYAIQLDPANPDTALKTATSPPSAIPFSGQSPPVVVTAKARRVPGWDLVQNSAGDTPQSPVKTNEAVEDVQLVPYGSTRLRVTEFPWYQ